MLWSGSAPGMGRARRTDDSKFSASVCHGRPRLKRPLRVVAAFATFFAPGLFGLFEPRRGVVAFAAEALRPGVALGLAAVFLGLADPFFNFFAACITATLAFTLAFRAEVPLGRPGDGDLLRDFGFLALALARAARRVEVRRAGGGATLRDPPEVLRFGAFFAGELFRLVLAGLGLFLRFGLGLLGGLFAFRFEGGEMDLDRLGDTLRFGLFVFLLERVTMGPRSTSELFRLRLSFAMVRNLTSPLYALRNSSMLVTFLLINCKLKMN